MTNMDTIKKKSFFKTIAKKISMTITNHDMEKLWILTKNNLVEYVSIDDVIDLRYLEVWENENNDDDIVVMPIEVIKHPDLFPSHIKRINNADLKYPILVLWPSTKDKPVDVVDGLHRLLAHVLSHANKIPVQRVTQLQLDETRLYPTN